MPKTTPTLVNLNTAPLEALTLLPGVGPALARRIIAARPFQSVRDLILVSGVGPRLYASLLPHLTLDDIPPPASPEPQDSGGAEWPAPEPPAAEERPAPTAIQPPAVSGAVEGRPASYPDEAGQTEGPAPLAGEAPADATALPQAPADARPARPRPKRRRPADTASHPAAPEPTTEPLPASTAAEEPAAEPVFRRPTPYFGPAGALTTGRPAAEPEAAARGRNRLLDVPLRTRWRILLALFYGMIALALVGLAALFYAALRNTPLLASAATATSAASLPAPAITASVSEPTLTRAATATPPASATPAPSQTAPGGAAGATGAPEDTPTVTAAPPSATAPPASATPSPTTAASPTPAPSATRTPPPSLTPTTAPSSTATPTVTPAPSETPTRTPRPTIAPTSPAGAGALLFTETFDPPAYYWGVGNTNFSRSAIRDGQLQVQAFRAALVYLYGNMPPARDLYYQATVRPGACGEGDSYGLQFRARDDLNFYLFGVTCEGRVRVQVLKDGQYTILVDTPQPDPAVRTGAGVSNVLAVRALGSQFQFYANGRLLTTLSDEAVDAGKFGLYARSRQTPAFDVTFDDVFAWTPAQ